ncbi:MAG: cytochrome c biogenesis protein CcdA [Chitinophagaceae bacterium]
MKRIVLISLCCAFFTQTFAESPFQWEVVSKKLGGGKYILQISGTIRDGWHIYSMHDKVNGLEPITVNWDNESITKEGNEIHEVLALSIKDKIFGKTLKAYSKLFSFSQAITISGTVPASFRIKLNAFASSNDEFLPIEEIKEVKLEGGVYAANNNLKLASVDMRLPAASCGDAVIVKSSLLAIFLKGFIGGMIALLMPCLFPMIPVTVSFFTNKTDSRRKAIRYGMVYGLSILSIYLLASAPFHLLSGVDSQIFNTIATNAWVNVAFFVAFILFALSLFGLFELKLPASLSNRAGANSNISSMAGIFFMALTLAIVSFSCTGPILGTLLVGSLSGQGNPWELTAGMAGFGLALALPFALFAMFPSWLGRLPKSGGWLGRVKKVLAFAELALAFKFLSNADLVEHWGLLRREVFIAIWLSIAVALGLYLVGLFDKTVPVMKLVHPKNKFRFVRPGLATACFLFAAYLIPGLTNTKYANLKLLSGFPPPLTYSVFDNTNVKDKTFESHVVNDYDKALRLSKQTGKPLLIDFTGWACVNCRKMEEQVWTQSSIEELIKEKFILVSLYVDDREKLPAQKQFSYQDKDIKTIGDKWAAFQAVNFGGASQPMYVVLSPDEQLMNLPVGYTPPVAYQQWLECGLNAWQEKKTIAQLNTIH